VTAETVNGNVDARMASLQGDDDMNFKTVTAPCRLCTARFDGRFRFDMSTAESTVTSRDT